MTSQLLHRVILGMLVQLAIRGVHPRTKLARAAKEVERTHPNPVPEGTFSGRVWYRGRSVS